MSDIPEKPNPEDDRTPQDGIPAIFRNVPELAGSVGGIFSIPIVSYATELLVMNWDEIAKSCHFPEPDGER